MDYIVSDTEKEVFQDENAFQKSQQDFSKFIQYAEAWQVLEFVSAMLGLLAMLILITISGSHSGKYYSQFGSNGRIQIC